MPITVTYPAAYVRDARAGGRTGPAPVTAFVGRTLTGPVDMPVPVNTWEDYQATFGGPGEGHPLSRQVRDYFDHGGQRALVVRLVEPPPQDQDEGGGQASTPLSLMRYLGDQNARTGLYALERVAAFDTLCIPPDGPEGGTPRIVSLTAAEYCVARGATLIVDARPACLEAGLTGWLGESRKDSAAVITMVVAFDAVTSDPQVALSCAFFYSRVRVDRRQRGQVRTPLSHGAVAAVWTRTDTPFGVCKAPAAMSAAVENLWLTIHLEDIEADDPGSVSADQGAEDHPVAPVRRLVADMVSRIRRDSRWAATEANDEALRSALRAQISTWLTELWRQGVLVGNRPEEAFFVQTEDLTHAGDIRSGRLAILIGFAPVRPEEFVVVRLTIPAGPYEAIPPPEAP